MFEFSMIPTINKPTRATTHTATAIDNIITNCILNSDFKSATVKTDFFEKSWNSVKNLKQPNEAYNKFLEIFTKLYDKYFLTRKNKIKPRRTPSPWITYGIAKSSKQKQMLYEKFLKHHTPINEAN